MNNETVNEIVNDMVEVELVEDFGTVVETLTRMGLMNHKRKELYQTAHLLHRQGKYYICHFKEMLKLDGLEAELSEEDIGRRNRIVNILKNWDFINPVLDSYTENMVDRKRVGVISYTEKDNWDLIYKYRMGKLNNTFEQQDW